MTTPVLSRTNGDNKGVMSFPIDGTSHLYANISLSLSLLETFVNLCS